MTRFLVAAVLWLLPQTSDRAADGPILSIGGDRQVFADDHVIASMDGVRLALGRPRDEGAVLRFDRPWEGAFSGYATVVHDGERFLLYYRGLPEAGGDGTDREVTCVALSSDGIAWTRPELGLFEVDGSKANNVVLAHAAPVSHNFTPFLDPRPGVDPARRFKALGGNERSGLIAFTSPDGLHWTRLRDEPVLTGAQFDSQNVAFWSTHEETYVCYMRTWTGGGYSGFRSVSRSTSADFVYWSEPAPMGFGGAPLEHVYTHQTHPYFRAPQVYVSIGARFMPGRQVVSEEEAGLLGVDPRYFKDCSDAILMTSRGGTQYDRMFLEAFVRPGIGLENWVSRSNYPALNVVQTGAAEMSFYMNQNYAQPTAELRRYSLRLDGLASIAAPAGGGEWISRPLTFAGERLELNFATSASGSIRVEIQDAQGRPIEGYTLEEAVEQIGNEIERTAAWRGGTDVAVLAGHVVRLRFSMVDADLYSFRFAVGGEDAAPEPAAAQGVRLDLRGTERIWDGAPHNAFTDLLQVGERLYCTFREGERHVFGRDGRIRVLVRDPSGQWSSLALLAETGVDLRDPKLSRIPDGRIMLSCGGSFYEGQTLIKRESKVAFAEPGEAFGPLQAVAIDATVRSENDWLWRVTWRVGRGYGIVYQASDDGPWRAHLVSTTDGVHYHWIHTLDLDGRPTETTLRFRANGDMVALVRREGGDRTATIGTASPPYTEWRFAGLPERLGGPNLVALDDGTWLAAGRRYAAEGARTILARTALDGSWEHLLTLPSGGDTSYPGLVQSGDSLLVSYYSSHEDKTAIYLATLELSRQGQAESGPRGRHPAWSPDGARLAFESDSEGTWDLFVLTRETGDVTRLTTAPGGARYPTWSPDGSRIAFVSGSGDACDLHFVDVATGQTEIAARIPGEEFFPAWSPDGNWITFCSRREPHAEDDEVYVLNRASGALSRLTQRPGLDFCPAWSPAGDRLIVVSLDPDGARHLRILDARGAELARLAEGYHRVTEPAWSPDGRTIAFAAIESEGGEYRIAFAPVPELPTGRR